DVLDRIQAHPPLGIGGQVAEILGGVGVRGFMQGDGEYDRQCINREGLDEIIHRRDCNRAGWRIRRPRRPGSGNHNPNTAASPRPWRGSNGSGPVRSTTVVAWNAQLPPSTPRSTSLPRRAWMSSGSLSGSSSPGMISVVPIRGW